MNRIYYFFKNAFAQITNKGDWLNDTPFQIIYQYTFANNSLHAYLHRCTGISLPHIYRIVTARSFIRQILTTYITCPLQLAIVLNDTYAFQKQFNDCTNNQLIYCAIINNQFEVVVALINAGTVLQNEMLQCACQYANKAIYYYLKNLGLHPNTVVLKSAIVGNCLEIIKDIVSIIEVSKEILEVAIENNNASVIFYLMKNAESTAVDEAVFTYPILHHNLELLIMLDQLYTIDYTRNFYYAALLSGSIKMIEYVQFKMSKLHALSLDPVFVDEPIDLFNELTYTADNKTYLAHVMNYAIQSESLAVVQYVYHLGYGISFSNLITAINQSTSVILEYLCQRYNKPIPYYIIHYLGAINYCNEKNEKSKIIHQYPLDTTPSDQESVHLQLIYDTIQINESVMYTDDYLAHANQYFNLSVHQITENYTLAHIRLMLVCDDLVHLTALYLQPTQLAVDALFYYGTILQIKTLYSSNEPIYPHPKIVMLLMYKYQ